MGLIAVNMICLAMWVTERPERRNAEKNKFLRLGIDMKTNSSCETFVGLRHSKFQGHGSPPLGVVDPSDYSPFQYIHA